MHGIGTDVVIDDKTLAVGSATTENGQRLSKGSFELIVGTGITATTLRMDPSSIPQ
jgi:hypothetical protein